MAYINKSGIPLISSSIQTGVDHLISLIQAEKDKIFESARVEYRQLEKEFKTFRDTSARRIVDLSNASAEQLSNATAETEKCRKDLNRLSRALAAIGIVYSPSSSGRLAFHGEWAVVMSEMERHRNVSGSGSNHQDVLPKKMPSPLVVLERLRHRLEANQVELDALRKKCHTLELERDELKRMLSSSPHVSVKSPDSKRIPVSVNSRIEEPNKNYVQKDTRHAGGPSESQSAENTTVPVPKPPSRNEPPLYSRLNVTSTEEPSPPLPPPQHTFERPLTLNYIRTPSSQVPLPPTVALQTRNLSASASESPNPQESSHQSTSDILPPPTEQPEPEDPDRMIVDFQFELEYPDSPV